MCSYIHTCVVADQQTSVAVMAGTRRPRHAYGMHARVTLLSLHTVCVLDEQGISIQSIFTSECTSRLPAMTHITCHGSAGSRAFAWALCIASGHAARPKDTSAISLQPLGRTPVLQVTTLHNC